MDAAALSSSDEEEEKMRTNKNPNALPSPSQEDSGPIDLAEVFRNSKHCESARNAGHRRRCREESRRLHPNR